MRASAVARRALGPRLVSALALAFAFLGPFQAQARPTGLEPSFRLPIAGKPAAPLLLDASLAPSAAWVLSEDHGLYLLSEDGRLLAKTALPLRPRDFLALDGAGRALVVLDSPEGPLLSAWTRVGKEAFRVYLGGFLPEESSVPSLALGSDDRLFLGAGSRVLCLAQNGQRLWSRDLSGAIAAGPVADGLGRAALGLADGTILVLSPYGETEISYSAGSQIQALSAFASGAWNAPLRDQGPGSPVLAASTQGGEVLVLDRRGRLAASQKPQGGARALASDGAVLYSLSPTGLLSAWSTGGSLLWQASTGVPSGRISVYAARLIVTGPGKAVSLDREGGVYREASFANAAGASVPASSGLLFSPGADWVLGAYPFEKALGPSLGTPLQAYGYAEDSLDEILLYDPALGDSGHRLALLARISASLDSGSLGAEEGRAGALAAAMARGDFDPSYPASEARFRLDPLPRVRAMEILGRLGSPESLPLLLGIFSKAQDPALRAAACDAIGAICRDPSGEVGSAFVRAIQTSRAGLDGQVASGIVAVIEALALRSGSPPGREALGALLALTQSPQRPDVKNAATRALSRIAGSFGP